MLTQFFIGIVFVALPLILIFGLPIMQDYFVESNFTGALEDCEVLFVEEPTRIVQIDAR